MRDRLYNVEVNLDEDWDIKSVSCECVRGQYVCHHIAAVCIYGHHNISVTDVECKWAARRSKQVDVKSIDEIYVGKTHRSTDRDLTEEEINKFSTALYESGSTVGFTWLLRPEPTPEASLVPDVEDVLFSEEYFSSVNKLECFLLKMKVSEETVKVLCAATVGQSKNTNWLVSRKNRLTASNFGIVLVAIGRKKYPPSLFKRLTGFYNLEGIHSIQWGVNNEPQALQEFSSATQLEVVPTGFWLDTCGFLGASPDGLVGANAIVEVKCPYKFKDKNLKTELKTDHSYIIFIKNDEIIVNRKHDYYHQIQGNLFITGREVCHLVIWTPNESMIIDVFKDDDWLQNIALLKNFYIEQYLPYIIENVFEN